VTPFDSLPMVSHYHPNFVSNFHRFRDMATYWSKIAEKTYLSFIWHVPWGWPLANFWASHTLLETETMGLSDYVHSRFCIRSARHNTGVWRTDKDRAMHIVARVKIVDENFPPHKYMSHSVVLTLRTFCPNDHGPMFTSCHRSVG